MLDLRGVAGFQPQLQEAAGDRHIRVAAVVVNADNVGAAPRNNIADHTQLPGLVLQGNHQVCLAPAHHQPARDHAGENVHINVAAGNQADGLFARQRQLAEQRRRYRGGTRALGNQLLVFHQREDRGGDFVLAHGHDVVNVLLYHFKGGFAGRLDRNAVGKGVHMLQGFVGVVVEGALHAGRTGGLYAVHLYVGAQALDGKCHAGNQPAAADGYHHGVHIGQLIQNLQPDGTLPGNDQLVIVGVDKGHTGFLLQLHRAVVGVIVGALDQLDLGTQPLGAFYLHNRGGIRHTHHTGYAHAGGCQRHALRVVARRAGNYALGALLLGQLADFIVGAAQLKAAGHLQIFGF